MKKMKKMLAVVLSTLLAIIPVMSTSVVALARSYDDIKLMYWENWFTEQITGIPLECSVPIKAVYDASFADYDKDMALYPEMFDDWSEEEIEEVRGGRDIVLDVKFANPVKAGETVTFTSPFSGIVLKTIFFEHNNLYWSEPVISGNQVSLECLSDNQYLSLQIIYKADSLEDQFWFKPMKTQLNIAAEIASTTNKEAVAEVEGDFALSYEIMKWLEDHPNVTLKYNLTYKEKDYNIVIKGGQKLANPEIPWYGPEYLIGNFAK